MYLLAAGAVVGLGFLLAKCAGKTENVLSSSDANSDAKSETEIKDIYETMSEILSTPVPDVPSQELAVETAVESSPDTAKELPVTPKAPSVKKMTEMPCAFPASLTYNEAGNYFVTACGGPPNALFRSNGPDGSWTKLGEVNGYPSNHIDLGDGKYLVTHTEGFTSIDEKKGKLQEVLFSNLKFVDASGKTLPFVPNNPAGAVFMGAELCVASSNLDHTDMDMAKTTFFDGTFICMPFKENQAMTGDAVVTKTAGLNATGMVLIDKTKDANGEQKFGVLSSNSYDAPKAGKNAVLEIVSWPSMKKTAIDLGEVTAQISPGIAISDSGKKVFISIQKPSSALYVVDVNSNKVELKLDLPQVENFISSAAFCGGVVVLSDFGQYGKGGQLVLVNTNPNGWENILTTKLDGSAGPSLCAADGLFYQTVTANSGASAAIFSANLGGLK